MLRKLLAKSITGLTNAVHYVASPFVDEAKLLEYKPVHLCWWFEKHGFEIPKYFIAGTAPPTVTTQACSGTAETSTYGNGTVTAEGDGKVTRRGFCYMQGTSGDPTIVNSTVYEDSSDWGTGAYSLQITGLTGSTTYRVRAYAINAKGVGYGTTVSVTTTAPPAQIYPNDIAHSLTEDNASISQVHIIGSQDIALSLTEDVGSIDAYPLLTGTYEDIATLPTDDTALSNTMTAPEKGYVLSDDNVYFDLEASNYAVKNFLYDHDSNTDEITVTWKGKSTLAPTSSTVYLQIYNYNTPGWETLDSDNTTAADTEFTLTGSKTTSLSNYYTTGDKVLARVYQGMS